MTTDPSSLRWPALRTDAWAPTRATLHMWLQIVGKIQLVSTPLLNHWWNTALVVSARGLRTGLMLTPSDAFDAEFDLVGHQLVFRTASGRQATVALAPKTVAQFWTEVRAALTDLGIHVSIEAAPNETDPAIPFADDTTHHDYDPAAVTAFFGQLLSVHRVFARFTGAYGGKQSPVQLFWGSFDLSQVRYSGRPAPKHQGSPPHCPPWVMLEAESQENSAVGFWAADDSTEGSFYAYAYPEPQGYRDGDLSPAHYDEKAGEWMLSYEAVRTSADPDKTLLTFLQQTYDRAADCGQWDRAALDLDPHRLDADIHPQF